MIIIIRRRKFCARNLNNDYAGKWYMQNPESVLENETNKLLWDFGVQTDHLISARRLDQVIVNKKKTEDVLYRVK